LIVYLKDAQYEDWKRIAESRGQSLSEFVKETMWRVLYTASLEDRISKLEMKEDGDFAEVDYELKMLWEAIGKVNKALKKLNKGEILEEHDFLY